MREVIGPGSARGEGDGGQADGAGDVEGEGDGAGDVEGEGDGAGDVEGEGEGDAETDGATDGLVTGAAELGDVVAVTTFISGDESGDAPVETVGVGDELGEGPAEGVGRKSMSVAAASPGAEGERVSAGAP